MNAADNIPVFEAMLVELIEAFAPSLRARIDRSEFGLARPVDLLQGRLTPVVRREAIADGGPYDERFCRDVEQRLWAAAEAPTVLSNALLEAPTPLEKTVP